ncbi:MAG TPA: hypothetical protein VN416_00650 [Desulfomonilia bacterium]|nr:hypothetical protein [Desulfomonilia bacterium]
MSDEVYERLRAFLDRFPLGYPKTASGLGITILKRLFAETITMHLRKDREEPFGTVIDMGLAILVGKKRQRNHDQE